MKEVNEEINMQEELVVIPHGKAEELIIMTILHQNNNIHEEQLMKQKIYHYLSIY